MGRQFATKAINGLSCGRVGPPVAQERQGPLGSRVGPLGAKSRRVPASSSSFKFMGAAAAAGLSHCLLCRPQEGMPMTTRRRPAGQWLCGSLETVT